MSVGYKFPIINNITDILPAIEGREEFIIADRGTFKISNYLVNFIDTFPPIYDEAGNYNLIAALRRECRGIAFDAKSGNIIRRPLHKFFNINERDETQSHRLDFNKPHRRYAKLDGSFITPFESAEGSNDIIYGTKMGRTGVGEFAEDYVKKNKNIKEFSEWCIRNKISPTFELTTRRQRIVIDYPVEKMTLLAARHFVDGQYVEIESLPEVMKFDIPTVEYYDSINDPSSFINEMRGMTGIEGFVIAWEDGYRVKAKTDEYCLIHTTKDSMSLEKNVINMLVGEKIDDLKGLMLDDDRKMIEKFEDGFHGGINETVKKYEQYFDMVAAPIDRKTWAVTHMKEVRESDPFMQNVVFGMYDGKDVRTMVVDHIKKNCSTQTKVDGVRYLWGGSKWQYYFDGDS